MGATPKAKTGGPDDSITGRWTPITPEMGLVLAAIEKVSQAVGRLEERAQEQGERIASLSAHVEQVATKADLSTTIQLHSDKCTKSKDNFTTWAKGIGIILGAIGALIGAFAAAWAMRPGP